MGLNFMIHIGVDFYTVVLLIFHFTQIQFKFIFKGTHKMVSNGEIKTNVLQSRMSCNWISQCLVNLRSHILVGMSFMGKVSRKTTK